ncbi:MAG: MerR family transcriptional regulator [Nitrospirae bacterium]|nr:MerR family transcriptional regulator [Nitrospirota bacterium]
MESNFPEKLFYKIGEVSKITNTEPYVLRYWETEFPFLHPKKNKAGQRVYLSRDIDAVLKIKKMLYEEGYTIAGVKKKFKEEPQTDNKFFVKAIKGVKKDLKGILDLMKKVDSRMALNRKTGA